jgi:hypothetical protein
MRTQSLDNCRNIVISKNVGGVKQLSSILRHALREEYQFRRVGEGLRPHFVAVRNGCRYWDPR